MERATIGLVAIAMLFVGLEAATDVHLSGHGHGHGNHLAHDHADDGNGAEQESHDESGCQALCHCAAHAPCLSVITETTQYAALPQSAAAAASVQLRAGYPSQLLRPPNA